MSGARGTASVGFLHTSEVHVSSFEQLLRQVAPGVGAVHVVDAGLLERARSAGADQRLRAGILERLHELADAGAGVIVCTCSTLGAEVEALTSRVGVPVLRVDRPLAEAAVRAGRRVALVAALSSTLAPSRRLLEECAAAAATDTVVVEAPCLEAWALFEASDQAGYAARIAEHVTELAGRGEADVVVLAQASMAPAVELLTDLEVPVLSAPGLAVLRAAGLAKRSAQHQP